MKHIGGRFRLTIFTLLLLIVSVVCFYFNKKLSNNYTEEVANSDDDEQSSEQIKVSVQEEPVVEEPTSASISVFDNEVVQDSIPLADVSKDWSDEDSYLLAKIAMAEAEGEDLKGKALVICTVLNRVNSTSFPDTIEEVIFANNGKIYQFSPVVPGGRWYTTEPNEDCYKAVEMVQNGWDESNGALYFESCKNEDNWHNRNLTLLFKHGCHRFYK